MISRLRNKYDGLTGAILGSGPSVRFYEEKENIAIAVNGAAFLNKRYDYFVTGDRRAPDRDWWLFSNQKRNLVTRLVSAYIAPFDPFLYPEESVRIKLQKELEEFKQKNESEDCPYCFYVPSIRPETEHLYFRFGGFGKSFVELISPEQNEIFWGGTISAITLQISLVLGFKKIKIYGCGFNNFTGLEYFYNCSKDQKGHIEREQIEIMQLTIDKIRSFDIEVTVIGDSKIY